MNGSPLLDEQERFVQHMRELAGDSFSDEASSTDDDLEGCRPTLKFTITEGTVYASEE
jgi:hypothetical protein